MRKGEPEVRPDAVVVRSGDPVEAEVDGDVVMMSIGRGKYYGLDSVGTRVWQMIGSPTRVSSICERLRSEFDVDEATCERDVLEFLNGLAAEGLIEVMDAAAG
jgi:hypothetical protein